MSINSICRVCLDESVPSSSIVSLDALLHPPVVLDIRTEVAYIEAFNNCTNLNAALDDDLPKALCKKCSNDLEFVYTFLEKARKSDKLLRSKAMKFFEENEVESITDEKVVSFQWKIEPMSGVFTDDEEAIMEPQSEEEEQYGQEEDDNQALLLLLSDKSFQRESRLKSHADQHDVNSETDERRSQSECPKCTQTPCSCEPNPFKARKTKEKFPYICNVCGKGFKQKNKLVHHDRTHSKDKKQYPCRTCPMKFQTLLRQRKHERSHTNDRKFECEICKLRFHTKNVLECHMRRHTGERPFKCEICGKGFTQISIMKTHMILHTGKTVECPICGKKFTRSSNLILHQRDHTGERPYACHLCPQQYKQKSHLNRHLDTHLGVKHKCEECGKEYSKKSSLNTHMKQHSNDNQLKCPHCELRFGRKDTYNKHVAKGDCRIVYTHIDFEVADIPSEDVSYQPADEIVVEDRSDSEYTLVKHI